MRLLIDTNIFVPLADARLDRLPRHARSAITDEDNIIAISVASLWEAAIKVRLGKLPLLCPIDDWADLLGSLRIGIREVSLAHVSWELSPIPETKDPFDRLLLAVCAVENMRLVTMDQTLLEHPLAYKEE